MFGRRYLLVAACLLLAGCGAGRPPITDQELRAYVDQRMAAKLVTQSYFDARPIVIPKVHVPDYTNHPLFKPPRDNSEAGKYIEGLEREIAAMRFTHTPKAPEIQSTAYDCRLPARLVEFEVTGRKGEGDKVEIEFKAVQELDVDLFELHPAYKYGPAIGWDEAAFKAAVQKARRQPQNAELDKQWQGIHASRDWMLNCVHKKGSKWPVTGKIEAKFMGVSWSYSLPNVDLQQKVTIRAVTLDKCPQGLMQIDATNPTASAAEWKRPFEEFIAAVQAREQTLAANAAKQPELLAQHLKPGSIWRTRITANQQTMDVELKMTELRSNGMYNFDLTVSTGGRQTKLPVFGKIGECDVVQVESTKTNPDVVPLELYGVGLNLMTSPDPGRPKIWNDLQMVVGMRLADDAPTLIWANKVQKLEAAK